MYFYLDTPHKKTSAIKVRYYVKAEKKSFVYSTGISINPINWNKENRMPKAKAGAAGFELKQITNQLNRYVEELDRKSTRLNSSHPSRSRMPSSA